MIASTRLLLLGSPPLRRALTGAGRFLALTAAAALLSAGGPTLRAQSEVVVDVADPEARYRDLSDLGPGTAGPFVARQGMVATSSLHASVAALETLRAGGNAFDAAVVAQFVLTVTEPYASGIGGGLFALGYVAEEGAVFALDGREESPAAFGPEQFRDEEGEIVPFRERATGGNAAGVPGTVAACARLLETRGTLSLAEAVAPAVRLAREGFPASDLFAANVKSHWDRISQFPESARLFGRGDGEPLEAGDLFRNPDLADTLERIGAEGAADFYSGEIARDIVAAVRESLLRPGVMTLEDLAAYRAVERRPVESDYRGYRIVGMPPPSSGGISLGLMLNLLEATGFHELERHSADSLHRFIDAQNLAFADRNRYLADADFAEVPGEALLDKDYARRRAESLGLEQAAEVPAEHGEAGAPYWHESASARRSGGPGQLADGGLAGFREESESTTHFSVVDKDRNLVAVTSTIEQHFGCGIVVPGRGFLLNNQLTDLDAEPADAEPPSVNAPEAGRRPRRSAVDAAEDEPAGGKRPRSSMTPTLVFREGEPYLVLGSPGGSRIIGITLNVLVGVLDHGLDPQAAVNGPRVVARNGSAELERALHDDDDLREELEGRGFGTVRASSFGSVQAILVGDDGRLHGAADPRREGIALGY